tara:strand:- start:178 stop:360 length:183 start_codon:yes stop_codon:yes gene_type:complete
MDSKKKFDIQNTMDSVFEKADQVSFEQFVAELSRQTKKLPKQYREAKLTEAEFIKSLLVE